MAFPAIIGVSGYAQAGKDTLAGILRDLYGYVQISFAKGLKDCVYALNPQVTSIVDFGRQVEIETVQEIVDQHGWEHAKQRVEIRRLLQVMGTEVGRDILGENIWVDTAFQNAPEGKLLVVSDMRFPNEYRAVRDRGGQCWRINRPGVKAVNPHVSETALDLYPFDRYIENDSSISGLADKVLDTMDGIRV